jgi:hypothetical protein
MSHSDQNYVIKIGPLYVLLRSELRYCDRPTVCLIAIRVTLLR